MEYDDVTEATARSVSEAFIGQIPPYPGGYSGRGIVMCAGGLTYFTSAWVAIRLLRHLGCSLPIEVWYLGRHEIDTTMEAVLAPYDVRCIDASIVRQAHPARILNGWELKPYAIIYSRFEEVLFLDADNLAVTNPERLFGTVEYAESGALFWPDTQRLGPNEPIWSLCGVQYQDERDFESGQIVVDKQRCWEPLCLTMWYNEHSDLFYRYIHGDKETFHMAWRKLDRPFRMPRQGIIRRHDLMYNHDFAGALQFQHQRKWDFHTTRDAEHIIHGPACLSFLDELRRQWNGVIGSTEASDSLFEHPEIQAEDGSAQSGQNGHRRTSIVAEDIALRLPASGRRSSLLTALTHLSRFPRHCPVLVEIGAMRDVHAEACDRDGWSSRALGWYAMTNGGVLHCVDRSPGSLGIARQGTHDLASAIRYHLRDGATFLREFRQSIDLLYIDAWDDDAHRNTAPYLDAYKRLLTKPEVVAIDDVPVGQFPAFARQLMAEEYAVLAHEATLLVLGRSQSGEVEIQPAGSSETMDYAVTTVARPEEYIHETIATLVGNVPLHLYVGSPQANYLDRYRSDSSISIVETSHEAWEGIKEQPLKQKATWNYWRALQTTGVQDDTRSLLLIEDDIQFAIGWRQRLASTVQEIVERVGHEFALSLYTAWEFPAEAAARHESFTPYRHDLFYGVQAMYYTPPVRRAFATYLKERCVDRSGPPHDHALRDYCGEFGIPLLQTVPCLVQHRGRHSTGLGFWHSAPCFTNEIS